jgi:putative (di)nucleoside polyphosphate hydrolase
MKKRRRRTTAADLVGRPYRPGVGVMLINRDGLVFVAQRIDMPEAAWQMPQGGIDEGEDPREAALRELKEETGTDKAEIIGETRDWLLYDLPPELLDKISWGRRYRGQKQKWFAMRFTGSDRDIDIGSDKHPEFSEWKWAPAGSLSKIIVPFKRDLYRQVVAELGHLAKPARKD